MRSLASRCRSRESRPSCHSCSEIRRQKTSPVPSERLITDWRPYILQYTAGPLGLLGMPFPEKYGGCGADYLVYIMKVEDFTPHAKFRLQFI
ncbi:MAG: acyl-CoA dehydrogenase family protein [Clostridiales Family XIII bacterium]|nr:acyl-CoA dehydrogenase family protein [Clostridiales Family XIII bacterium]